MGFSQRHQSDPGATMMWNCTEISHRCAKTLLIVLNGCSILLALSTFVFAMVDTKILKQYGEDNASGTFIGDIIIILACFLLVTVAAFGSLGAFKEHVQILYLYIGFLMIMVVLQLLISIYVSLQRYGLQFRVSEWLREDFFRNETIDDPNHRNLWDELQLAYECCGLNGPDDYAATQKQISLSCCPRAFRARTAYAQQQLFKSCVSSDSYFKVGCEDEILYVLKSDAEWLIGVAVTGLWFEGTQMLLAMLVANYAKNKVTVYKARAIY